MFSEYWITIVGILFFCIPFLGIYMIKKREERNAPMSTSEEGMALEAKRLAGRLNKLIAAAGKKGVIIRIEQTYVYSPECIDQIKIDAIKKIKC